MSVRSIIISEMQRVAAEQKQTLGRLEDSTSLLELGLDSLGFAILVARLEEVLGVDPFTMSDDVAVPVTLGDLADLYEQAFELAEQKV